jgi:2-polyprenyl-6-methoxyphenol hydroxylase-like FAD-dependent oxidoreductase
MASSTMHTPPRRAGQRAVVLGGGMSGLLAVAALSEAYDEVVLVERDPLRSEPVPRRGVPQGRHVHVLLSRGAKAIEALLPGILSELTAAGGMTLDNLNQLHADIDGHVLCQADAPSDVTHLQTRPFLERQVLARVRGLSGVRVLDGHDVVGLRWEGTRVVGATVVPRTAPDEPVELDADLTVSALGRNGRVGAWLTDRGYQAPTEQELRIDLMYATRLMRFDAARLNGYRAVLVGATASRPTGVSLLQQEDDAWIVTVEAFAGHHPPTDPDGWLEEALQITPPQFRAALRGAEPLTDVSVHRFPANLWRRYDRLRDFPEGLLVTGDSICSFNPIYAQGMTVAAMEAEQLRELVRSGTHDLAHRFFHRSAKPVRIAWEAAVSADLSMPPEVVPGRRTVALRAANAYLDRYLAAAEHDEVLAWDFLDVTGLDKPARTLFSPHALRSIARTARNRDHERGPVQAA